MKSWEELSKRQLILEYETRHSLLSYLNMHRKPGYDPVELFIDQKTKSIPLDASLVKGSHGRPPDLQTEEGLAFYASSKRHGIISESGTASCVDIVKCLVDVQ